MINIRMQDQHNRLKPRIAVIGVGGAGGNAVGNMIASNLEGCEFVVCNTDAQALEGNPAGHKIQLGVNVTRGLGAGANPEIGRAAAEESVDEILGYLEGANMVFVTAGMGGGTGTGAAPVVAQAARDAGILTVGVVTKPFHFEGTHRMKLAEDGINELQKYVDTLIIIPNQNLFRIANEKTTFSDAFRMADEVLQSGVRGVTDLMVMPGLINLDFADIRAVMAEMGKAMMGTGEATGERRAVEAAEAAISNPLLDDVSMKGARGVLINITGGMDMTLFEVDEAANRIRDEVDPDANIIFGSTFDPSLDGRMRVSVVATGIDAVATVAARPLHLSGHLPGGVADAGRRPAAAAAPRPQAGTYAGFEKSQGRLGGFSAGGEGIPASIIPSQGAAPAGIQPVARRQAQPAVAQRLSAPVAGGGDTAVAQASAPVATGHAQAAPYASPAATARKLDEDGMDARQTWTHQPAPPPMTQNYQRPAAPSAGGQPRGTRVGDTFIPPRPVDPRAAASAPAGGDLFGHVAGEGDTELSATPRPAAPRTKKSPSLFERFTMQREKEAPVAARAEATKLSVEDGDKSGEDELDIPAFLRRQAN